MNYSLYGEQSQLVIARLAINGALDIITNNMKVNDSLLSILLQADLVKRDHKIMLLTMAIPGLNEESCKLHFDELGLSDLNGIFSKGSGRRNYEKSWEIAIILDILKLNGWIYEYHDDERNINRYVIIKNRPRRKVLEILD
jgi:ribosomal protein L36